MAIFSIHSNCRFLISLCLIFLFLTPVFAKEEIAPFNLPNFEDIAKIKPDFEEANKKLPSDEILINKLKIQRTITEKESQDITSALSPPSSFQYMPALTPLSVTDQKKAGQLKEINDLLTNEMELTNLIQEQTSKLGERLSGMDATKNSFKSFKQRFLNGLKKFSSYYMDMSSNINNVLDMVWIGIALSQFPIRHEYAMLGINDYIDTQEKLLQHNDIEAQQTLLSTLSEDAASVTDQITAFEEAINTISDSAYSASDGIVGSSAITEKYNLAYKIITAMIENKSLELNIKYEIKEAANIIQNDTRNQMISKVEEKGIPSLAKSHQ